MTRKLLSRPDPRKNLSPMSGDRTNRQGVGLRVAPGLSGSQFASGSNFLRPSLASAAFLRPTAEAPRDERRTRCRGKTVPFVRRRSDGKFVARNRLLGVKESRHGVRDDAYAPPHSAGATLRPVPPCSGPLLRRRRTPAMEGTIGRRLSSSHGRPVGPGDQPDGEPDTVTAGGAVEAFWGRRLTIRRALAAKNATNHIVPIPNE